jgi:hypothetical protein
VENRQAVPERNVLRADVMVAPLDFIAEIIRDNHWGYLYNCACTIYPRLVREFYGYLEVIQDEDHGIILQTSVRGHTLQIDPQVISAIIDVPVLTWSPLHWSSSGSIFMPIHMPMSKLMLLSRSVLFLPRTDCLQRLFCTIYDPQLVGVSLF